MFVFLLTICGGTEKKILRYKDSEFLQKNP